MRLIAYILLLITASGVLLTSLADCSIAETNRVQPALADHRSHHTRARDRVENDPTLSLLLDAEDAAMHAYYQAERDQNQAAFDKAKKDLVVASEAVDKRLREDGL